MVPDRINPITTFPFTGFPDWFRIRANGSQPRTFGEVFSSLLYSSLHGKPSGHLEGGLSVVLHGGEVLQDEESPGGII